MSTLTGLLARKEGEPMNTAEKNWTKGADFMDDSPRYTFDGRDPSYTYSRIEVVIYQERIPEYRGGDKVKRYFVWVFDKEKERLYTDDRKPFRLLKEAKRYAENAFNTAEREIFGN